MASLRLLEMWLSCIHSPPLVATVCSFSLWCEKNPKAPPSSVSHCHPPGLMSVQSPKQHHLKGEKKCCTDGLAPWPGLVQAALGLDTLLSKHNLFSRFLGNFRSKRGFWSSVHQTPSLLWSTPLRRSETPLPGLRFQTYVTKPCSWHWKGFLPSPGSVLFSFFRNFALPVGHAWLHSIYPGGFWKWKTTEDAEWPHLKRTVLLIGHKDRNSECGPKPYLCRAHEST